LPITIACRNFPPRTFSKRTVSPRQKRWIDQRDSYIKYLVRYKGLTQEQIAEIPKEYGAFPLDQTMISKICENLYEKPITA